MQITFSHQLTKGIVIQENLRQNKTNYKISPKIVIYF